MKNVPIILDPTCPPDRFYYAPAMRHLINNDAVCDDPSVCWNVSQLERLRGYRLRFSAKANQKYNEVINKFR